MDWIKYTYSKRASCSGQLGYIHIWWCSIRNSIGFSMFVWVQFEIVLALNRRNLKINLFTICSHQETSIQSDALPFRPAADIREEAPSARSTRPATSSTQVCSALPKVSATPRRLDGDDDWGRWQGTHASSYSTKSWCCKPGIFNFLIKRYDWLKACYTWSVDNKCSLYFLT